MPMFKCNLEEIVISIIFTDQFWVAGRIRDAILLYMKVE